MCDSFVGKWQLVESDKFDDYMKEVGVGFVTRKAAGSLKPLLEVTLDSDKIKMHSTSTFKNHTMEFKLNEETELDTADGRKMKSTFEVVDGKLIQHEKPISASDKPSEITRWIEGNKLIMTLKSGDVICKRVYEKQ
ncbi:hypothetical protein L596_008504 [Steinernema carpocapsae]|uniref:Lipocalin/cytosolic fatty-acid binding domain-containing protein n=1 Tax=Steinernema carpocapsae TaxID=34508 RepID=A0A4V6A6E0_STECR|nr:hypothetical protein L596_008504 [Steinernema carpocapsae]